MMAFLAGASSCDEKSFIASQKAARSQINEGMDQDLQNVEALLDKRTAIRGRLV
jgi:hypothetical protein